MKVERKLIFAASAAMVTVMTYTIGHLVLYTQPSPTKDYLVELTQDFYGFQKEAYKMEPQQMQTRMRGIATTLEQLWCATRDVGSTGGFCLTEDNVLTGGNHLWDVELCRGLENSFGAASVVDLGAGLGHYGRCFLRRSESIFKLKKPENTKYLNDKFLSAMGDHIKVPQVVHSWHGYDGAMNVDTLSEGFISYQDLTEENLWLGRKWDWVLSLEVGEHIPRQFEDIFVNNLKRHSCQGIVLSWGVPGQPGHHHVNGRSNEYIKNKMDTLGYDNDMKAEALLRGTTTLSYFRNTIMVFRYREPTTCTVSGA